MRQSISVPKPDTVSKFVAFFSRVHPLSEGAADVLTRDCFSLEVPKKGYILKPGIFAEHFYFIVKGVVHGYIKEAGKQITTWFMEENEIAGAFRSLGTDQPCDEYLQALEDCELVAVPIATTEYLFDHFPESNVIARRMWELKYRQAEERAYLVRISNATRKYNRFVESHPGLLNRISLKHVASHLGMTLETLSRVRSRQGKI